MTTDNRTAADPEQRFSDWQRSLTLTNKSSQSEADIAERQQTLVAAVHGGSSNLVDYLQAELRFELATVSAPQLPRTISPSEFRNPPLALEQEIATDWRDQIHASDASQPSFWTRAHAIWIAEKKLAPPLPEALLGRPDNGIQPENDEDAVRNLLRRMGGLPHVRGSVSVLNDCPLSRAWWRHRLAVDAAQHAYGTFDVGTAHRVLHSSNDAWARLVGDSVRRITVVNHSRLRAALIYHYRDCDRDAKPLPAKQLQTAVRQMAQRGPALIFDLLEWDELIALTGEAVEQARIAEAATSPSNVSPPTTPTQQMTRFLRRLAN